MRKALYLVALASFGAWIAIAEIIDGNIFLALNTILASIFILLSPLLFAMADDLPQATDDTSPPSSFNHDSAFVAGAVATRER